MLFGDENDEDDGPLWSAAADAGPKFNDDEIEAFSLAADLQDARPGRAYNDNITPDERRDMTPQK
jgi:hypothetical protein